MLAIWVVWLEGLLLTFCSGGGSFVGGNYSWINIGLGDVL